MKRILTTIVLALSLVMFSASRQTASAQVGIGVSITYQDFYDELSPHGRWIDYPEYGYVWAPTLGPGFQPYQTGGHWVWSDEYDWMWVSDYSWGWAPFHYGRWFYDDFYGWMWVPGYEWSPAWVSWRTGGDYYGWAPLRPGISISIGFGSYNPPYNYWCFAPRRYINSRSINNYCVDRSRNVTIINNTTIINNYGNRNNVFVNGGPRRNEVERYAGRIRPVNFRETNRPGGREFRNNNVSVYRPQIQRDNDRRFAPRSFDQYDRNNRNNRNVFDRNNRNNVENGRNGNRQQVENSPNVNIRQRDWIERSNRQRQNQEGDQSQNNRFRRNIFDRPSSDQQNQNTETRRQRQNVFDRPNGQQQNNDSRRERPNISNRGNQSPEIERRSNPNIERRNRQPQVDNRRNESPNVFQRNNRSFPQTERREMRSQQQNNSQSDRPSRQFRQPENNGGNSGREQRRDNNNGGRRFDRRGY